MENFYLYLVLLLSFLFMVHYHFQPKPKAFPLIGHSYLMLGKSAIDIKNNPEIFFQNLLSRFGSVLLLQFGCQPVLIVSCPEAVKECFTSNDSVFADRPKTLASDFLSYGYKVVSFVPNNDLWKTLRNFIHHKLFSRDSLEKYSGFCEEENTALVGSLISVGKATKTVDLMNWFYLLVFNITMKMISGTGSDIRYQDLETEEGQRRIEDIRNLLRPHLAFQACDFFPILRVFSFLRNDKEFKMLHEKRDKFLQEIVDKFHPNDENNRSSDLDKGKMPTFIESIFKEQESHPNVYTNETMKALLLTMFSAGTETSATTMDHAISHLLDHPQDMKRLREEIDTQVGTERFLTDKNLDKMPFLKCIIMETLRLDPPVKVILPHLAKEECRVQGKVIPKGTILLVNAWAMHRDPNVWEEPDMFKPERFELLKHNREQTKIPYGTGNIPFGMGKRACPGDDMALRTILLAVGSLVQRLDLEKDPIGHGYQCTPRPGFGQV